MRHNIHTITQFPYPIPTCFSVLNETIANENRPWRIIISSISKQLEWYADIFFTKTDSPLGRRGQPLIHTIIISFHCEVTGETIIVASKSL